MGAIFLFILYLPQKFFLLNRKNIKLYKILINVLNGEFKLSIGKVVTPGVPYIFTATSHLSITVRLALPVWLGYIIFSTLNNINFFLSHLVPTGTPYVLIPFMVIIELISRVIRPLTLSV